MIIHHSICCFIIINLINFFFSIDKAMNSLGYKIGYALPKSTLPNPIDMVLVFSQKVKERILSSFLFVYFLSQEMETISNSKSIINISLFLSHHHHHHSSIPCWYKFDYLTESTESKDCIVLHRLLNGQTLYNLNWGPFRGTSTRELPHHAVCKN